MILKNNTITDVSDFSEKIFENGLSIYEVIRVYNGHPIFLSDNLQRLDNSIKNQILTYMYAIFILKIS